MSQTTMQHRHRASVQGKRRGFTLNEILIALGVFAVGMIAVASLLPAAAILQRETADEVSMQNASDSAQAIVEAVWPGIESSGDLANYHTLFGANFQDAVPLSAINTSLLTDKLSAFMRSYPTSQIDYSGSVPIVADCDLFWVPFLQDINGDENSPIWVLRLFMLQPDSRANYLYTPPDNTSLIANYNDSGKIPKVFSADCNVTGEYTLTLSNLTYSPHGLRAGDVILDNNGNEMYITSVTGNNLSVLNSVILTPNPPTKVWYAPTYQGTRSPGRRILTLAITPTP